MTALAKRRVFDAVFPTSAYTTSATPAATPLVGTGAFGDSFASTQEDKSFQSNPAAETIRWERAWHVVTDFLALPKDIRRPSHAEGNNTFLSTRNFTSAFPSWFKPWTANTSHAVAYVIMHGSAAISSPAARHQNVFEWYLHEAGQHYLDYEYPKISKVSMGIRLSTKC